MLKTISGEGNKFERAAKLLIYVLSALLPLWFLPLPVGVENGREITFAILIACAGILWLLSALTTGGIRLNLSPVLYGVALFSVVAFLSAFFSSSPFISSFFSDPVGERLSAIIMGAILFLLIGGLFKKQHEIGIFVFLFVFTSALSAAINLIQLVFGVSVYGYLFSVAQGSDFNIVGTQNGLALFYSVILGLTAGITTSVSIKKWKPWLKYILYISAALFLLNLMVINFRMAWYATLGISIFLFGLVSKDTMWRPNYIKLQKNEFSVENNDNISEIEEKRGFNWRNWTALGFLLLSIVMLLLNKPLYHKTNISAEISPTFTATLQISLNVFKEGVKSVFFGSGVGTFGIDWGKYKPLSINQTQFWNLRFTQGFSWLATLAPTMGVLGVLSFLALIASSIYSFLRRIFNIKSEEEFLADSLLLAFVGTVFAAIFYPASFTMVMMFFFLLGLLSAYLSRRSLPVQTEIINPTEGSPAVNEVNSGGFFGNDFWAIEERKIKFASPWSVFLSSLIMIFFISLGVATLYMEVGKIRSAWALNQGIKFSNEGKNDEALTALDRMVELDSGNFRNYQTLVQVRTQQINNLINQAVAGQNVQNEFQTVVSKAVQNSQEAINLYPEDASLWRTQGSLYELVIPYIQGSERLALESYRQAIQKVPFNPALWVDLGRAGMTYADQIGAQINKATGDDKEKLTELYTSVLTDAQTALNKATELKPDYASAHFLTAQVAIRLGDIKSAIKSTENAKLAAPFDIGVAFQLGILYYQNNDLNKAQTEFERAISLDESYSNARYFLGLVYDKKGDKEKSTVEFQKILELNPDNEEIKNILKNLSENKDALAGIVPPAAPPAERKTAPVEEQSEGK